MSSSCGGLDNFKGRSLELAPQTVFVYLLHRLLDPPHVLSNAQPIAFEGTPAIRPARLPSQIHD